MLSPLKTTSVILIILGVINAIAAVLVLMIFSADLDPSATTALAAFIGSTSVSLLFTGIALRSLHTDLDANISSLNSYTSTLKKRIEALEKKM